MERLKIYRPLRSKKITQGFYDNKACFYPTGKIVGKSGGSCPSGSADYYKSIGMKGHGGIDIALITGENIYHGATFDGWMKTEKDSQGGIGVDVVSNEPLFFFENELPSDLIPILDVAYFEDRKGYLCYIKERQWHLKATVGFDGKQIKFGQVVGLGGSTGASSAPHDHLAFKYCDKNGGPLARNNGYNGSFDFSPFYDHETFAGDVVLEEKKPVVISIAEREEVDRQLSTIASLLLKLREFVATLKK